MELMQQVKGYSDSREEEEEEESSEIREESSKQSYPFSSPSLSSPSKNYTSHHINLPHHQNPWLGMLHHDHHQSPEATCTPTESHNSSLGLHHQDAASNFANHRKLDLMDLSLGNKDDEANFHGVSSTSTGHGTSSSSNIEKEHMFDKVVTPSDVGKLNRLVIPKQHAERYFPLDSSTNEKGLLLNFEDRNGKLWRFRYSYWNSSQSYVMTKGWSRFVKEKKLDAGDIVSFQRGVGELYRHRLYIDWRRRPDHHHGPDPTSTLITPLLFPNQQHLSQYSVRWGSRLYSLPSPAPPVSMPRHHQHLQQLNYNNMYPFHQQHHRHQHQYHSGNHQSYNELNLGSGSLCYQNLPGHQEKLNIAPMIIDSVPVAHHGKSSTSRTTTAGKRLRLFGVNMECGSPAEEPQCSLLSSTSNSLPSSSLPPLQYLRASHEDPLSSSARFENQKGETSVLFDLDPSFQYRP